MQLSNPPLYASLPRWSPDRKQIVFFSVTPGKPPRIYLVSAEGGSPQELLPGDDYAQADPYWSPDGSALVFGSAYASSSVGIRILDMKTRSLTTLPPEQDLAVARAAVSEFLGRGGSDSSTPWENPRTGARGTALPGWRRSGRFSPR